MTDKWILQNIELVLASRNRLVLIDPSEQSQYLLPVIENHGFKVLKTDAKVISEADKVKDELMMRYQAESEFSDAPVIFYVTRPKEELTFLFDYCATHGNIDLTSPTEWLKRKLFTQTGHQVTLDNSMLLTAAKLGIGKDLAWWAKILQNLEELVSLEDELVPFLSNPDQYLKDKESDVKRLFEEKLFELIGQPHRKVPAKTLATEAVNHLFNSLLNNDISPELLNVYYKWLDSQTHSVALGNYLSKFKIEAAQSLWNVHPDHCFKEIDLRQLREICNSLRDLAFVKDRLNKLLPRIRSKKAVGYVPNWWNDVQLLVEFDVSPLNQCHSLEHIVRYYTSFFHRVDRAIRNLYEAFLSEKEIIRPLQEYYEQLNASLLDKWFDFYQDYRPDQQGYLVNLLSKTKPGVAVIVGDGVRYEIAAQIAQRLSGSFKVIQNTMLADMPSETEHNMSALYSGGNEIIPKHKDRERALSAKSGKDITYGSLEAVEYGQQGEYLVLTYKDIDSAGEKLQQGAIKLFNEFEKVLADKIQLLLNIGYREVHLVTDHGFVLTGLLDESDKVEPDATGNKEVHERFLRTYEQQSNPNWMVFERPYEGYNYVYSSKTHRPFKSKGVYGFSHGGFTPQEIVIPNFVFTKEQASIAGLQVQISNKKELQDITGEFFGLKIKSSGSDGDIFASSRKIQVLLYSNQTQMGSSNILTLHAESEESMEFSFSGQTEISVVIVDADSQEQLDSTTVKKSSARDLGGLL
jgi:hypothetical protein